MDRKYYDKVGERMIDSFHEHWGIDLIIYWEGDDPIKHNGWVVDLVEDTDLRAFRERNKDKPHQNEPDNLHHGACRFAPKAYSIIHRLRDARATGHSIWIDADVFTHTSPDEDLFKAIISPYTMLSYLGRKNNYTDLGRLHGPYEGSAEECWKLTLDRLHS